MLAPMQQPLAFRRLRVAGTVAPCDMWLAGLRVLIHGEMGSARGRSLQFCWTFRFQCVFLYRMFSLRGSMTGWPSRLRRWRRAAVRKGAGSNATAVRLCFG